MLNETAGVSCSMSVFPQPHFKRREWTNKPEPGLSHDYYDCTQMRNPEPQGVDPPPPEEVANDHCNEAANDKRDEGYVQ